MMREKTKEISGEEKVPLKIWIPKNLYQKFKAHAKKNSSTMTSVHTQALTYYLKQDFDEHGNPVASHPAVQQTHPLPLHMIYKNFYAREEEAV